MKRLRFLTLAALALVPAACDPRFDQSAGGPARTDAYWLDRRDLAEIAHCPPPPRRDEAAACGYLAWDFRR